MERRWGCPRGSVRHVEGVRWDAVAVGFCLLLCDPSKLLTSLSLKFASNLKRSRWHPLPGGVGEISEHDKEICQAPFGLLLCH